MRATVQVYDVGGWLLGEIGSTTVLPFVFVWDGRDRNGDVVSPGVYILACELIGLDGGGRRVEKVVVGCARAKRCTGVELSSLCKYSRVS